MKRLALILCLLLFPAYALAEDTAESPPPCPEGHVCVEKDDMAKFFEYARNRRCRATTNPTITVDPVHIIVDKEGRVFGSGTGQKPSKIHIDWCNYDLDFHSQIGLDVAQAEESEWGFRLRVKATMGVLASKLWDAKEVKDVLDVGVLVEPFYFHWANVNAYVGVRSFGVGLGADITSNFGAYLGYSMTWGEWEHTPFGSLYFAF